MSEIDIVEDEAHQQLLQEAIDRGDLKCNYEITLQSTRNRRNKEPLAFSDKGWVFVHQEWEHNQIVSHIVQAIKNSDGLIDNYDVLKCSYILSHHDQSHKIES